MGTHSRHPSDGIGVSTEAHSYSLTRQGSTRQVPCKRCDECTGPVIPMASLGSNLCFLGWNNET